MAAFITSLTTAIDIPALVTMQQTMLAAAIIIPLGFVAFALVKKTINRSK